MRNEMIKKFISDNSGATAIEYGLIAALISVVIIGALSAVGTAISNLFQGIKDEIVENTPA